MEIIKRFTINGFDVTLGRLSVPYPTRFNGQKLLHPLKTHTEIIGRQQKLLYDYEYVSDEVASLMRNTSIYGVKHDGACGALVWNDVTGYEIYTRFDIKYRDGKFETDKDTSRWIPCEECPTDPWATHWPHFRPCSEDDKAYKWQIKAFEQVVDKIKTMSPIVFGKIVTLEFMGKKFAGKDEDQLPRECEIVLHGTLILDIPPELRTPTGFYDILEVLPIEGLVAYPKDSQPLKIRKDLFRDLTWGTKGKVVEEPFTRYVTL